MERENRQTPDGILDRLVRSVKSAMPGVRVEQLTAARDRPIALALLEAFASVAGEWLFLDTDVIVRKDVRHVFDKPFDVAVATREGTFRSGEEESKFMALMPYNKGAVFSRSQDFWKDCAKACRTYKTARQHWMGDQQAVNDVIRDEKYDLLVLPKEYNYPPKSQNDDLKNVFIVHYKGGRKDWMRAA